MKKWLGRMKKGTNKRDDNHRKAIPLSEALSKEMTGRGIDLAVDYSEIPLDGAFDEELLKEIPFSRQLSQPITYL